MVEKNVTADSIIDCDLERCIHRNIPQFRTLSTLPSLPSKQMADIITRIRFCTLRWCACCFRRLAKSGKETSFFGLADFVIQPHIFELIFRLRFNRIHVLIW